MQIFQGTTNCTYPKGGPGGLISPEDISKSILNYSLTWKVPLDCTWVIKVEAGWKHANNDSTMRKHTLNYYYLLTPHGISLCFLRLREGFAGRSDYSISQSPRKCGPTTLSRSAVKSAPNISAVNSP
ncbi:uncharacterized protein CDAR_542221 [Caerostris darwini]|uniref:CUB domain-containing protein n=1 Tax=Caerostris darwini TaxID=1538125 RepID=A0AAV4PIR3_9ARAC|nr:uncharacterized protein CDAR_542221 [Caerostris darwini]